MVLVTDCPDMEITLFELHLDDSPVTAHAPFSGRGGSKADETEESGTSVAVEGDESEDEATSGSKAGPVLALLVVVGLAVAARRFMNSGSESEEREAESSGIEASPAE